MYKNYEKFKDILDESVMSNAGYAFNRVLKPNSLVIRLIWLLSLLIFSALCSFLIAKTITNYLQYEVVTKINLVNENPSPFPTISICNLAPFDRFSSKSRKFLSKIVNNVSYEYKFGANTNSYRYYYMSNVFDLVKNDTERQLLGFSKEKMFYLCIHSFAFKCNESDFEWFYDFFFGNCYRFNPQEKLKSYKIGKIFGLHIEIDVGDNQEMPWISEKGIHLFIHNKSHRISMHEGIDAPVGKTTNIALSRVFTNKLEMPYSDCVEDLQSSDSRYYKMLTNSNFTYQQSDCLELCFSEYLFDECKCHEGSTIDFFNGKICKTMEEIKCMESFLSKFYSDYEHLCNCPLECHSVSYKLSTSFSSFPTSSYAELYSYNYDMAINYVKEVTLSLNIFYEDFRYTVIDEKPKIDWTDLLSSIGG